MVAPIIGPIVSSSSNNVDGAGSYSRYVERYRQSKPYNLPLAYRRDDVLTERATLRGNLTSFGGFANASTGKTPPQAYACDWDFFTWEREACLNVARERFISKTGERAELGVTIAERQQAFSMIANRAKQLLTFGRSIARADFVGAVKSLNLNAGDPRVQRIQSKWRKASHSFSSRYLEFHFGWSPLIGDIYSAGDILQQPFQDIPVRGVKRMKWSWGYKSYGSCGLQRDATHESSIIAVVGGRMEVTNHNLFLLNRMGLVNPATLALELIPFSFVGDWFVNFNQYLAQFTESVGVSFKDTYHTVVTRDVCFSKFLSQYIQGCAYYGDYETVSRRTHMRRTLGLPQVNLRMRPPWTLQPRRALAAISLLITKGLGR